VVGGAGGEMDGLELLALPFEEEEEGAGEFIGSQPERRSSKVVEEMEEVPTLPWSSWNSEHRGKVWSSMTEAWQREFQSMIVVWKRELLGAGGRDQQQRGHPPPHRARF